MPGMSISSFGVAADHLAALKAAAIAPFVFWLLLLAINLARRLGSLTAKRWLAAREASPLAHRAASWLLFSSGLIHLALVPTHRVEEPGTARLFALDGCLLVAASLACLVKPRWRRAVIALLVANVVAYLGYLLTSRETVDQLGVASKLIELTALGFLLAPTRAERLEARPFWAGARRLASTGGLIVLTLLTGATIWVASIRAARGQESAAATDVGGVLTGMVMQPAPRTSTSAEAAAANAFAAATARGIAKYAKLSAALADGYRASTSPNAATVHYSNPAYEHDGRILDPEHPETLVYANTPRGPVLLGAMYQMPKIGQAGPDFGGAVTRWHVHTAVCFSLVPPHLVGFVSPFGSCPSGSLNLVTPAMMHVWTVDVPGGPYSDLSPEEIAKLGMP